MLLILYFINNIFFITKKVLIKYECSNDNTVGVKQTLFKSKYFLLFLLITNK